MKNITLGLALALSTLAAAPLASAQSRPAVREVRQQQRINAGTARGQVNAVEHARLERGQAHVQNVENRAAADGVVTRREQAHVERAQDVQSVRIYRARHNGR